MKIYIMYTTRNGTNLHKSRKKNERKKEEEKKTQSFSHSLVRNGPLGPSPSPRLSATRTPSPTRTTHSTSPLFACSSPPLSLTTPFHPKKTAPLHDGSASQPSFAPERPQPSRRARVRSGESRSPVRGLTCGMLHLSQGLTRSTRTAEGGRGREEEDDDEGPPFENESDAHASSSQGFPKPSAPSPPPANPPSASSRMFGLNLTASTGLPSTLSTASVDARVVTSSGNASAKATSALGDDARTQPGGDGPRSAARRVPDEPDSPAQEVAEQLRGLVPFVEGLAVVVPDADPAELSPREASSSARAGGGRGCSSFFSFDLLFDLLFLVCPERDRDALPRGDDGQRQRRPGAQVGAPHLPQEGLGGQRGPHEGERRRVPLRQEPAAAPVGVVGPDDRPIPVERDAVSRERGALLVELDGRAGLDRVGEERGDAEVRRR